MLEDKKILITGGAGAIGSVLTRRLVGKNEVTIVDNFSSGRQSNVEKLGCRIVSMDIRDRDKLLALFNECAFEVVIHLAAHFANQNSVDYPSTDLTVNIAGTLNILELCRLRLPRIVYASSSCVYGSRCGPLKEDAKIEDLHTPYAISKFAGELYCRYYAEFYGIETVILRFFNNYGPFDPPGVYRNVIPNFVMKGFRGEDLVITGTGEETRDFNYIENTVDAIVAAASGQGSARRPWDVFNVGTGIETRIIDLAKMIVPLTGNRSQIRLMNTHRKWDQTPRRCADINAIRERLGYEPRVFLAEGLPETIEWLKGNAWQM